MVRRALGPAWAPARPVGRKGNPRRNRMRRMLTAWIGVAALALAAGAGLAGEEPLKRPPQPAQNYPDRVPEPHKAHPPLLAPAHRLLDEAPELRARVHLFDP